MVLLSMFFFELCFDGLCDYPWVIIYMLGGPITDLLCLVERGSVGWFLVWAFLLI